MVFYKGAKHNSVEKDVFFQQIMQIPGHLHEKKEKGKGTQPIPCTICKN
jgi:hypothetical protein